VSALRPATLDEYLTWLRAWLTPCRPPTHAYDYPWSRWTWLTATRDFTLGGECGANAVHILVPDGIDYARGDIGHNELYFMNGPVQCGGLVPVFSDPGFQSLPGVPEFIAAERLKEAAWMREQDEAEEQRRRMAADSDVPRCAW